MLGYSRLIERWRYRFLLTVLLATILLQPLLNDLRIGQAILVLAYGAIMAGGVYATRPQPWISTLCSGLTLVLVGLSWYFLYSGPSELAVTLVGVTLLLGAFTVSRTLIALVAAPDADSDAMAGAIFGYFLLALVWAMIFRALNIWSPGAFGLADNSGAFTDLLYFSLVTITTLGYGDISPVDPVARISAGFEAATGSPASFLRGRREVVLLPEPCWRQNRVDRRFFHAASFSPFQLVS
jgi:hypothetical protein